MKLSISNIGWTSKYDKEMYSFLKFNGFTGLEIAPTRIFPDAPYEKIVEARDYKKMLSEKYELNVSSMQSIWHGRKEQIFDDSSQRTSLIEYTKKAFSFAQAIECRNVVFGCPNNRNVNGPEDEKISIEFFNQLGDLAVEFGTTLAIEANPIIYGTNYLNTTQEAYELISKINNPGIKLNYDFGTVIFNKENVEDVSRYLQIINHVHISEPNLDPVVLGEEQNLLLGLLLKADYTGFISIEMKNTNDIELVKKKITMLKERCDYYESTR